MNALFSARRGFPRSLLCSFMLPALAAYAGSARALECVGVVRPEAFPFSLGKFLLWPVPAKKN